MIHPVMRILLVKTSSLGDVVHNLPVASDIARHLPETCIDWLVEEGFAELPRLHPAVQRVVPVALRRWRRAPLARASWREFAAFRADLQAEPYDCVLDTQGLIKSAALAVQARLTLVGRRCGFAAAGAREPLAALSYHRRIDVDPRLHAIERNRLLASRCLGLPQPGPLDYGIDASPWAAPWLNGPYAVLLTASSRVDKQWPQEHWRALAQWLDRQGLTSVFPGGTPAERAAAAELAARSPRAVAAPAMNLTELARVLAGARLVVGVDTGLVHLAAALGRPTLALFIASDPELTGVRAGDRALNLGRRGAPPHPTAVFAASQTLLAAAAAEGAPCA